MACFIILINRLQSQSSSLTEEQAFFLKADQFKKSTTTKEETYKAMLSQQISNMQNCETFRNFKESVVVLNTTVPEKYIPKWTTRTELEKKIFWLYILMHHYCENNETKSKISRDSHSSGNNKKPFSDNYAFQQSVHNRHPTAALLIILLRRMICML